MIGATTTPVPDPHTLGAEPRYRPSTRLARFVRTRDLTCTHPGCTRPAQYCDLDHAVAYGRGPTHPANLRCLCRKHHLLKTFWTGAGGWTDRQLPDGTIVWTAPTGHSYRSPPGSRLLFPRWDTTTPAPPTAPAPSTIDSSDRGLAMPLRTRTRTAAHTAYIRRQRQRPNSVERSTLLRIPVSSAVPSVWNSLYPLVPRPNVRSGSTQGRAHPKRVAWTGDPGYPPSRHLPEVVVPHR